MEEKLIKKINLENSLEVEFFDASKNLYQTDGICALY